MNYSGTENSPKLLLCRFAWFDIARSTFNSAFSCFLCMDADALIMGLQSALWVRSCPLSFIPSPGPFFIGENLSSPIYDLLSASLYLLVPVLSRFRLSGCANKHARHNCGGRSLLWPEAVALIRPFAALIKLFSSRIFFHFVPVGPRGHSVRFPRSRKQIIFFSGVFGGYARKTN
jgi:hypothetical protein